MTNKKRKVLFKLKSNNGESITEALVTFFISTVSIMIIATSIIASQKIIKASAANTDKIHAELVIIEDFLAEGNQNYNTDVISISSDGYLYSEEEVEYIETNNKKMKAFR